MIAEIEKSFSFDTLQRKADYHQDKIDKGVAEIIRLSSHADISEFLKEMNYCVENDNRNNISNKYTEISLNLNKGERLEVGVFQEIAKEYLEKMGYNNEHFIGIVHNDKAHYHLHILASRIDENGKEIRSGLDYFRSAKVCRDLEEKYNLVKTEYNKFNSLTYGESKQREFYFSKALQKGLRNASTLEMLKPYISTYKTIDFTENRNIDFYEKLFGDNFDKVGEILKKKGHFNPLLKDELLQSMDIFYAKSDSLFSFQEQMKERGLYMRMVKGEFVYGIVDSGFYVKEKNLPMKYRFQSFKENGMVVDLTQDVQKNYIYNHCFDVLRQAKNYDDFVSLLDKRNVKVIDLPNKDKREIYFSYMKGDGKTFKSFEISNKLSYDNIQKFLEGNISTDLGMAVNNEKAMERIDEGIYLPKDHPQDDVNSLSGKKKKRKKNNNLEI